MRLLEITIGFQEIAERKGGRPTRLLKRMFESFVRDNALRLAKPAADHMKELTPPHCQFDGGPKRRFTIHKMNAKHLLGRKRN
jgi:hypothetical protein